MQNELFITDCTHGISIMNTLIINNVTNDYQWAQVRVTYFDPRDFRDVKVNLMVCLGMI